MAEAEPENMTTPPEGRVAYHPTLAGKQGAQCVECGTKRPQFARGYRKGPRRLFVCLKCARKDPDGVTYDRTLGRFISIPKPGKKKELA